MATPIIFSGSFISRLPTNSILPDVFSPSMRLSSSLSSKIRFDGGCQAFFALTYSGGGPYTSLIGVRSFVSSVVASPGFFIERGFSGTGIDTAATFMLETEFSAQLKLLKHCKIEPWPLSLLAATGVFYPILLALLRRATSESSSSSSSFLLLIRISALSRSKADVVRLPMSIEFIDPNFYFFSSFVASWKPLSQSISRSLPFFKGVSKGYILGVVLR